MSQKRLIARNDESKRPLKQRKVAQCTNEEWTVELSITKMNSFLKLIELIKKLVNECKIEFSSQNGLTIVEGDSNAAALLNVVLRPNIFASFYCKKPIDFTICVHDFYETVKSMHQPNSGNELVIKLNEYVMQFKMEDARYGVTKIATMLAGEKQQQSRINPTKNQYSFMTHLPSKNLNRFCETLKKINADQITFEIDTSTSSYSLSGGTERLSNSETFQMDQGMMIGVEQKKVIKESATVPLFYVQTVAQAYKLNERVAICLGPNLPFLMRYNIFDGVTDDETSTFTAWITRIEKD